MYQLDSVSKQYSLRGSEVVALAECNLSIRPKDFLALLGPSGSGKTTLLSILGGMLTPTSGKVSLDGVSLYELSAEERTRIRATKIGFVFQTFNLIPWLTALENVQVPLMINKMEVAEQRLRAMDMLEQVGLAERMDHRPHELSQGQQQRVALARTLANNPDVILADEPTGNLDSDTRIQVMQYLTKFHEQGRTIILVTHDADTAAFANRAIRLEMGRHKELSLRASA